VTGSAAFVFAIRRADPTDAASIAAAHLDSIRSIGPLFYPSEIVHDWGARISDSLYVTAMQHGEVFYIAVSMVEGNPMVVGFASHRVEGQQHRTAVYVRGMAARQGVGSALFRSAEAEAIAAGATSIHVAASLAAVEFYKRNGFEVVRRGEHALSTGRRMACVFMRKPMAVR
jgi:putative acetyltransferase